MVELEFYNRLGEPLTNGVDDLKIDELKGFFQIAAKKNLAAGCQATHRLISSKVVAVSDIQAGCKLLDVCTGTPTEDDLKNSFSMINSVQREYAGVSLELIDLAKLKNSFDYDAGSYYK